MITKTDSMPLKQIEKCCSFMGRISHSIVMKVQEVYNSKERVYLVSPSLKNSHKPLSELESVLNESQITRILEKLLQMCVKLHRDGIAVANLHPNNIFVDEENLDDVLVTDVGFAYMPGMVSETAIQTSF